MEAARFSFDELELEVDPDLIGPKVRAALTQGRYEGTERRALARLLVPEDIYFEIGAGMGVLSALAWRTLRAPGRIFAYEANPRLIPVIQRNWSLNGVEAEVHHCMLGHDVGSRSFYVSTEFWASSGTRRQNGGEVMVPQKDFIGELNRVKPTMLMMDIEGGEHELLMRRLPDCLRKIVVEIHPAVIGRRAATDIVENLILQGFLIRFDASHGLVMAFERELRVVPSG